MPNRTERTMVSVFPETIEEGTELSRESLSITVLPWTNYEPDELRNVVEGLRERPSTVFLARYAFLGEHGQTPVLMVEPGEDLKNLHARLLGNVGQDSLLVSEGVGKAYQPHMELPYRGAVKEGAYFHVHDLTVVRQPLGGGVSSIHSNTKLGY